MIASSAGLNGKSAVITLITSKRPRADRPRRDQREEGDRQGDHEGEQGDGADLARRRPERRPGRRQRRRPDQDRRQPEAEATPFERHEDRAARPASGCVTTRPTRDPEQDLLAEQRLVRDQPAGEPRVGVLLPLQRQRPRHQQHGDEGQGEGRGDRDREGFERRRGAADRDLVDFDRLRQAFDQRPGDVEVFAPPGWRIRSPRSGHPQRPVRHRRFDRFEDVGAGSQAEDVDRPDPAPASRRR